MTKRKVFTLAGIALAVLLIGVGIYFYSCNGLNRTVEKFLSAVREQNFEKAYGFTSKQFQQITSLSAFKNVLNRYPSFIQNESAKLSTKNDHNKGEVDAILKAKDGSALPVNFFLISEDRFWKIYSIQINEQPSAAPAPQASNPNLPNLFEDKNNRYSIRYPLDWTVSRPNKGAVVLRGPQNTIEYSYTVDIETIFGKKLGGEFSTVDDFVKDLKKQYANHTTHLKFTDEKPISITTVEGKQFSGKSLMFTYIYDGYTLQQWQIIIMRSDDAIFYLWAFTSPKELFVNQLPIAKMILGTWTIY